MFNGHLIVVMFVVSTPITKPHNATYRRGILPFSESLRLWFEVWFCHISDISLLFSPYLKPLFVQPFLSSLFPSIISSILVLLSLHDLVEDLIEFCNYHFYHQSIIVVGSIYSYWTLLTNVFYIICFTSNG